MDLKFKKIKYSQIATDQGRRLRLDERPGIYAWYRSFDLREFINDKNRFIDSIDKLLSVNLSDTFQSKVGVIYDIVLTEKAGKLAPKKREWLESVCKSPVGREVLSDVFLSLSEIQSPLYIGKAINIRNRIAEHVNGQSELVERLQNAGLNIDSCFVKILYLNHDEINEASELISKNGADSLVLLIEDLITRLGPAAFVRRSG